MSASYSIEKSQPQQSGNAARPHTPELDLNGPIDRPFDPLPPDWIETPIVASLLRIAERHPGRIAIRDRGATLTYRHLVEAVARLVASIGSVPARHGAVGLLLPNAMLSPVAALACLAAGRAFVPFDLNHPPARIAGLIEIAALDAVIVAGGDAAAAAPLLPPGLARIDASLCYEGSVPDLPAAALGPDSPAAILHTSGSTGRPKPVVLSQAALLQRVLQQVNAAHVTLTDHVCPLSSPCTIAGQREQLLALLTGATLHILDPYRQTLAELRRAIGDQRITVIYAVPALIRAIVQADGLPEDLASLRLLRLGGDAVLWRDITLLRQALSPECHIQVGYSSTESPGLQWFVPRDAQPDGAAVPLGYELPGTRIEVLDDAGHPAPQGEIGELVLHGRFIALGLWQNGKCVPDRFQPSSVSPNERTNRSGDLVVRRSDGLYAYAGRRDHQVKIRGQRVDATEVEATLRGVPGVLDAAAIAIPDPHGATLVAFAKLSPGAEADAVRRQAAAAFRAVPAAMRPSRLHLVPIIPQLPSAKPDLPALLALDRTRLADRQAGQEAGQEAGQGAERRKATRTERAVARAWRKALDLPDANAGLTWSEAGGDSLRLLDFVMQLERITARSLPLERFHGEMRLRDVFETIDPPATTTDDTRPEILFFPGIEDDSISQARFRQALGNQARFKTVAYSGWQTMAAQGGGMEQFVAQAVDEALRAPPDVPLRLAGYSFGGVAALAAARRLIEQGRRVEWLAIFDSDLQLFADPPPETPFWHPSLLQRLSLAQRLGWKPRLALMQTAGWKSSALALLTWLTIRDRVRPVPFRIPLPHAFEHRVRYFLRRDMMAAWLRRPRAAPADLPVILFRTDDYAPGTAADRGWSAFAGPVEVHRVGGDHDTMFLPPYGADLAELFARTCLDRAVSTNAPPTTLALLS